MKARIKAQFIYEGAATRAADFEIQVDQFFPAATLHFIVARKSYRWAAFSGLILWPVARLVLVAEHFASNLIGMVQI